MAVFLIGIDDTDNLSSRGTGWLARRLSDECASRGLRPLGVTRHQFLVHPAIPYTSHNSGACIALESPSTRSVPFGPARAGVLSNSEGPGRARGPWCSGLLASGSPGVDGSRAIAKDLAEFIFDFVARNSADGSDPGVCLAKASDVPDFIIEFAYLATKQVVTMAEAYGLAERATIALRGLGGTCQGVIGALASVGLRAAGNDGRFIDLPGLRELHGCVDVAAFDRIGVAVEYRGSERVAGFPQGGMAHLRKATPKLRLRVPPIETLDWVRPRLVGGKAVLPLEWCEQKNAWIPVDRKQGHSDRGGSRS